MSRRLLGLQNDVSKIQDFLCFVFFTTLQASSVCNLNGDLLPWFLPHSKSEDAHDRLNDNKNLSPSYASRPEARISPRYFDLQSQRHVSLWRARKVRGAASLYFLSTFPSFQQSTHSSAYSLYSIGASLL